MADKDKRTPDWFDPWDLRGSLREPLSLLGGAARMVAPAGQSLTWITTTAARRMRGTRIEIHGDPPIEGRVAHVGEVVPARAIPIPGISSRVALWERADLSLDRVEIGGKPIERVDVRAADIAIADSSAQVISVGHVELTVSLTKANLDRWMDALQIEVEVDLDRGVAVSRPIAWFRWLRVAVEPVIRGRELEIRVTTVGLGRLRVPVPSRLVRPRALTIKPLPKGLQLMRIRPVDAQLVEIDIEGQDLNLAVDIARVVTDIGIEGTMSAIRVLRL